MGNANGVTGVCCTVAEEKEKVCVCVWALFEMLLFSFDTSVFLEKKKKFNLTPAFGTELDSPAQWLVFLYHNKSFYQATRNNTWDGGYKI